MVLVFGLAATPLGWVPTGMVAVTVIQRFAAPAVPCTEGGDAVAAVATSASQVAAAVIRIAVRWVSFMMSCLPGLAPAGAYPPSRWACRTAPGLRLAAAPVNKRTGSGGLPISHNRMSALAG